MSVETFGLDTSTTLAVSITAHASANTKGSWTELTAATSSSFEGIVLLPGRASLGDYLFDVAIGGSGSEQIIVENAGFSVATTLGYRFLAPMFFPIRVPAGTRIAARVQSTTGANIFSLSGYGILARGFDGHFALGDAVETMGANTADSGGTNLPGQESASGWGAWTEITASSSRQFSWLAPHVGLQTNNARSSGWVGIEIGVGGAGSETGIFVAERYISSANDHMCDQNFFPGAFVNIPSGTRIAARAYYGSAGTNASKQVDLILHGA